MIHNPVNEVVRNIKSNLGTPHKASRKHHVSSAAKDAVGYEENVELAAQ